MSSLLCHAVPCRPLTGLHVLPASLTLFLNVLKARTSGLVESCTVFADSMNSVNFE